MKTVIKTCNKLPLIACQYFIFYRGKKIKNNLFISIERFELSNQNVSNEQSYIFICPVQNIYTRARKKQNKYSCMKH